jgi:hypothetical protein
MKFEIGHPSVAAGATLPGMNAAIDPGRIQAQTCPAGSGHEPLDKLRLQKCCERCS